MIRYVSVCVGLSLFLVTPSLSVSAADRAALYGALKQPDLDSARIAEVENVTLRRDVATFLLKKGDLYFLKPVSDGERDHVTGALFLGEGTFSFSPPTRIEKDQLARFYKVETLEQPFKILFLRFADTTFVELERHLVFRPGPVSGDALTEKRYCERYVLEKSNEDVIGPLLKGISGARSGDYFYAHIGQEGARFEGLPRPVFFVYNPYNVEEVQFQNRIGETYIRQTITQFHRQEDYQKKINFDEENKEVVRPTHYEIAATIDPQGEFSAKTGMAFDVLDEQANTIDLWLSPGLEVKAVQDESGSPLSFEKEKDRPQFMIFLNHPLKNGQKSKVSVSYKGDVLNREGNTFFIKSSVFWYPRCGYRGRTTYDLTFRTPKALEFISIGENTEDRKEGDYRVTRWVQKTPVSNASFNLGQFQTYDVTKEVGKRQQTDNLPPIVVFQSGYVSKVGKNIGVDIVNSLRLFQNLFGPYPYGGIFATEIPYGHGESFPSLLHLSGLTFLRTGKEGYEELFRAHEVAHQWWGIAVGFKTYHDQWLSEAFAQYAGLWYVQLALKDNRRFFDILDGWQESVFSNRKYVLGSGVEAGPIWLGYRTSSSETAGDYDLVVYKKGAFVLHMLRNLFMDLNTLNDDAFIRMLQDYFGTFRGQDVSTADFRQMVENHLGMKMDWFFDQWVYGTDLPTYKFSYSVSKTADEKYLLAYRVTQEGVPPDFRMYVPVTIQYAGGRASRFRILVDKPSEEFTLPPLPLKPEKIVFNDFHSVLAKVKYE